MSVEGEIITVEDVEIEEVEYISEEQSSKITNLYTKLGYDPARIIEKNESLERQLGKPYDQFTREEAEKIIANMAKALKNKIEEEEKLAVFEKSEEPKEEKVSAIEKTAKKTEVEAENIKNSEEYKAAFPEKPTADDNADKVSDSSPYENMTEEALKSALRIAKTNFSVALKTYKEDESEENLKTRNDRSKICSDITSEIIKK